MGSDANCIFCRIASGDLPCWKLFEDDQLLAFLDLGPLSKGHCLVIPREHAVTIDQLSAEASATIGRFLPALSRAVIAATGVNDWNILQNNGAAAGQAVGHVHFHLIPRVEGDGLGFRWPAGKIDDHTASSLVEAITAGLGD